MQREDLIALLILRFGQIIKAVTFRKYISDLWILEFNREGLSVTLELSEKSTITPIVGNKTYSALLPSEVISFMEGFYGIPTNGANLRYLKGGA